jgi:hypothetical protein
VFYAYRFEVVFGQKVFSSICRLENDGCSYPTTKTAAKNNLDNKKQPKTQTHRSCCV